MDRQDTMRQYRVKRWLRLQLQASSRTLYDHSNCLCDITVNVELRLCSLAQKSMTFDLIMCC
jgi:hypothetical protein